MDIHLITLNIPYPPDYGGMIDTFYRIKALSSMGVKIHLHCFEYGRQHSGELESLCDTVNYYPRRTGFVTQFSALPYIVSGRSSKILLENLLKDESPILFDGLHTTYYLNHPALSNRKKLVRLHNIEHLYYKDLAEIESNILRKAFYLLESFRLQRYEKVLQYADHIFAISEGDKKSIEQNYQKVILSPPFHPYEEIKSLSGNGEYIIYHGDLSVKENASVADSLILNVFSKIPYHCIVAGKNPPEKIGLHASQFTNIRVVSNPDEETMQNLIMNAHINLLPAKSANGIKLKILSALFAGRHLLVNSVIAETYPLIRHLCNVADSDEDIIGKLDLLMRQPFTKEMILARQKLLQGQFNNQDNAKSLVMGIRRYFPLIGRK